MIDAQKNTYTIGNHCNPLPSAFDHPVSSGTNALGLGGLFLINHAIQCKLSLGSVIIHYDVTRIINLQDFEKRRSGGFPHFFFFSKAGTRVFIGQP